MSPEVVPAALRVLVEIERSWSGPELPGVDNWRAALAQSLDARVCSLMADVSNFAESHEAGTCRCLLTLGELLLGDEAAASIISSSAVATIQSIASNTVHCDGSHVAIGASVRGHAFAALGKLCLQREELAKKSVELFVLHLSACETFTVRNNVLLILRELCECYTSVVERFVACMADLLRDPSELLRKQSVMVLASLLSESYIKFRGPIVHRFLYVLSDPAGSVRKLAESVVIRILHPRNPAHLSQVFVDIVCSLNGWAGHAAFQSAVDNKDFTLLDSPKRRTIIYRFMLSLMTNEQKFSLCSQMVTAFLTPFTDIEDRIELPESDASPCGQALHDILSLLVCKEMRICFSPKQASQDDDVDLEASQCQINAAARSAVADMFKRVMCDHVVPVLVQLVNLMEAQHSVFLGSLRRCLCEILREFKDELHDILASDRQLANEIAFDLGVASEAAVADAANSAVQESGPSVAEASVGCLLKGQRQPLGTRGLSKAAAAAVVRAGSKRRSLGKVLLPTTDATRKPSKRSRMRVDASTSRAARSNQGTMREAKSVAGQHLQTVRQPPSKRARLRPLQPTTHEPSPPVCKVEPKLEVKREIEVGTPRARGRDVATPHMGRSPGVVGMIMNLRAMDPR